MRLGVIDIGSNTVHLLVVDAHYGAAPIAAHSHKIELRLSEHMTKAGAIDDAATEALIGFVGQAQLIGEDLGVTQMEAFATSAIREAVNGDDVLRQVRKHTGVTTTLLSGDDEARLTFLAARRWFGWSAGRILVLDIGGGSLEIAIGDDEEPDLAFSMPLGAGRLTRERLSGDPPDEQSVRELRRHVRAEIAASVGRIQRTGAVERVVATSGVSEGRAPQLVAGALVAEASMDLLDVEVVDICPWALREGVILRLLDGLDQ